MLQTWMALALLCTGIARGAGPTYSADHIVNASNFTAGPFAPNSVLTIFGTGLARSTYALAATDLLKCAELSGLCLPVELNYVRVYVQGYLAAALLYVSESQINFVMPSMLLPGPVTVRVVVEGTTGPYVTVILLDAAPALFPMPVTGVYCIATSADGKLLTADAPSHANDTVVVYLTGLGLTSPNPGLAEIPNYPATIKAAAFASLKVALNGTTLDPLRIKYAGITPGSAGLYQINILLPDGTGPDPEIRVSVGDLPAQTGLKLALR